MNTGIFQQIHDDNYWANDESVSGHGSDLASTSTIRSVIPLLLEHYGIKSMLDIPCGDLNWISKMKLPKDLRYIGADVVPALIDANINKLDLFEDGWFDLLDITKDQLPKVDLILCRDLLGHFSNRNVQLALRNVRESGAKYLLATTFPTRENPLDIKDGEWRPINLGWAWGLGSPLEIINEHCTIPGYEDKALGLWELK